MRLFFKIILTILLLSFFSNKIIFSKSLRILLTGPHQSGSNIFCNELTKKWEYIENNLKIKLVKKIEISQIKRLEHINNNKNSLAIIDAETAHEKLKKYPNIRVLSLLWENWLFAIGNVQEPVLSYENTKTFLIHENSYYFANLWKTWSPKTKFKWFNKKKLPNLNNGLSEEVLVFNGPKEIIEIFYWLENLPGIQLLLFDKKVLKSLRFNYKWLIPKKIKANTFPYQTEDILGLKWHPVLVGHSYLSENFVLALLKIIYGHKEKIAPHYLFKNLKISDNKIFRDTLSFHVSSKKMFLFK
tara:strand:- start:306 stop:1205 length:900 start_codon:yes stop_codon:yes gene_type:complete